MFGIERTLLILFFKLSALFKRYRTQKDSQSFILNIQGGRGHWTVNYTDTQS